MKLLTLMMAMCVMALASREQEDKMIKLEDIERDTLIHETIGSAPAEQKELIDQPHAQHQAQHVQVSYSHGPQEVFVTPMPRYAPARENNYYPESPLELRTQLYHLPKVHEAEQTYTVPAKQTLIQPIIGGSQPIHPILSPQPQYIYVQSPHIQQQYTPQAHSYVMLPYASQYTSHQAPLQAQQHQHPVLPQPHLPTPAPAIYTYHGPATVQQQPSYQSVKSIEYAAPSSVPNAVTPLQTAVDYKGNAPIPIVPRKTLPSVSTTSFQQYYSPGLEYHYSEALPVTKLSPQQSYSYQQAPTHSYLTNYASQTPSYSYYTGPISNVNYNKHQSSGLLESYVPSVATYARQQQQPPQFKNYYPTHYQQQQNYQQNYQQQNYQQQNYQQQNYQQQNYQQLSQQQIPQQQYSSAHSQQQQLFTPAQQSTYTPYPTPQAYNTIQYSVSLPPYDHRKRSTSKATATLSVKAPKSN